MTAKKKTRVIVVDDSAVVRAMLSKGLSKHPGIEVVATASDPYKARNLIVRLKPDVITLDLEMPRMDGLEFIAVLMKHWPLPIVVVSSLVEGRCETSLKALELGAVEVFAKPTADVSRHLQKTMSELAEVVCNASRAKVRSRIKAIPKGVEWSPLVKTTDKVVAIGASTGGTEAVRAVLQQLPAASPGLLVVQHMPEMFTKAYADRLNGICPGLEVREAVNGDFIRPGLVLIAPGNKHLLLRRSGARYYAEVKGGPLVSRHRPSVDVLFHSAAETAGKNAVGVIMTGMGGDGAKGLLAMRQAGARTIAQDEKSCVVYGMPREAVLNGAAERSVPLLEIAASILSMI
ncbi:MAG: chemotaxis response regulator protein-glutamate methylesterase [Proteobacteria bacterium]|nr:chemotaxis response regulator protein-glutamate methylesterase [Pseudomonadota bacterium]